MMFRSMLHRLPGLVLALIFSASAAVPTPKEHFGYEPGADYKLAKYDEIYTGWAYPPKDWAKWEELVFQWAKHSAEKYGEEDVLNWYWQTWNEANIGYWRGTRDEFFKLHDHAIHAVRRAIPKAKVGGPDLAGGAGGDFLRNFIEHCLRGNNHATGETGTPLDFVSFHAKGQPRDVGGRVQMGLANLLRDMHIGSGQDDGNNFNWAGRIDDVGFWDTALSQSEIQRVIANGVPEPTLPALLGVAASLAFRRRRR